MPKYEVALSLTIWANGEEEALRLAQEATDSIQLPYNRIGIDLDTNVSRKPSAGSSEPSKG